jgi:hypothetical protein
MRAVMIKRASKTKSADNLLMGRGKTITMKTNRKETKRNRDSDRDHDMR